MNPSRWGRVCYSRCARPILLVALRWVLWALVILVFRIPPQLFRATTRHHKNGVDFLAWLNARQDHFRMIGGQRSARSILHFAEAFRHGDAAGLLRDPERARMRAPLAVHRVAPGWGS